MKKFTINCKADTQGSLEAILQTIDKLPTEDITVKIIHSGVGE